MSSYDETPPSSFPESTEPPSHPGYNHSGSVPFYGEPAVKEGRSSTYASYSGTGGTRTTSAFSTGFFVLIAVLGLRLLLSIKSMVTQVPMDLPLRYTVESFLFILINAGVLVASILIYRALKPVVEDWASRRR